MAQSGMSVAVVGTGYVGTVTGVCLAYLGHKVFCVDTDAQKIETLRRGEPAIYEPHLDEMMRLAAARGGIEFTTDLQAAVRQSDVVFIAVGTPSLPNGAPDLSYLEAAAQQIGAAMDASRFRVVVNKSTVPVGSGNLVEALVREGIASAGASAPGIAFGVVSNPEFLREGTAISDSLYPDRIVIGSSDTRALFVMQRLYRELVAQEFEPPACIARPRGIGVIPLITTSLTSAEMIKYAANAFLAMKIGFANEIANVCEAVGAEAPEVLRGVGMDSRIGRGFLNAGLGWGGSCFGKDVHALLHTAREYGYAPKLLESTLEVNSEQRKIVIQKLQQKLRILKGRTIGLLGLSFKPNTDDLRDAPSLGIAERLLGMGARVKAYDPISMPICRKQHPDLKLRYCESAAEVAEGADALVLVTEWPEFATLDLKALAAAMNTRVLIDGRNLFSAQDAADAGFDYTGFGRAAASRRSDDSSGRSDVVAA